MNNRSRVLCGMLFAASFAFVLPLAAYAQGGGQQLPPCPEEAQGVGGANQSSSNAAAGSNQACKAGPQEGYYSGKPYQWKCSKNGQIMTNKMDAPCDYSGEGGKIQGKCSANSECKGKPEEGKPPQMPQMPQGGGGGGQPQQQQPKEQNDQATSTCDQFSIFASSTCDVRRQKNATTSTSTNSHQSLGDLFGAKSIASTTSGEGLGDSIAALADHWWNFGGAGGFGIGHDGNVPQGFENGKGYYFSLFDPANGFANNPIGTGAGLSAQAWIQDALARQRPAASQRPTGGVVDTRDKPPYGNSGFDPQHVMNGISDIYPPQESGYVRPYENPDVPYGNTGPAEPASGQSVGGRPARPPQANNGSYGQYASDVSFQVPPPGPSEMLSSAPFFKRLQEAINAQIEQMVKALIEWYLAQQGQ
ncbi:hypothetical protein FJY93_04635 [Candidatus Kaiserbacteria bacterium]|nr:hypothetical protein [Candidatus Kaiserbacteria bacterium]